MKILFVTTISLTVNSFLLPHIRLLTAAGHQVDVACSVTDPPAPELAEQGCTVHDLPFQRRVLSGRNVSAYRQLRRLVRTGGYDLVHTHTPVASACARLACRDLPQVRVFYTAHGFHFHRGAPLLNWLVYYPVEWWLSRWTDVLITINREDHERAQKSFRAGRVVRIPGIGLDRGIFGAADEAGEGGAAVRRELGVPSEATLLLSVGELNRNKNHQTVVRALARLADPSLRYVICGQGPGRSQLESLAARLGVGDQVILAGQRRDIPAVCAAADIFVFPSFREGLSVSLMEAMAAGLPVICSAIRGNSDLITADQGGLLLNPADVAGFAAAIRKYAASPDLRRAAGDFNRLAVEEFALAPVLDELDRLYRDLT